MKKIYGRRFCLAPPLLSRALSLLALSVSKASVKRKTHREHLEQKVQLTWQTTREAVRLRARGIDADDDDDTSDVLASNVVEAKLRGRRPATEHAKGSAHRLPVEEVAQATAVALGRRDEEEEGAPRLARREEEEEGNKEINETMVEKNEKSLTDFGVFSLSFPSPASPGGLKKLSLLGFILCSFQWRSEGGSGASR